MREVHPDFEATSPPQRGPEHAPACVPAVSRLMIGSKRKSAALSTGSPLSPPQNPAAGCRFGRLEIQSRTPQRREPVTQDGSVFVKAAPSGDARRARLDDREIGAAVTLAVVTPPAPRCGASIESPPQRCSVSSAPTLRSSIGAGYRSQMASSRGAFLPRCADPASCEGRVMAACRSLGLGGLAARLVLRWNRGHCWWLGPGWCGRACWAGMALRWSCIWGGG